MKPYRASYQIGQLAEWLVILRLWLSGWRILELRWKCPAGEVDVIACRAKQLSFLEVKARKNHEAAVASVTALQQQRIQRAAALWLAKHQEYAGHDCRFDVMSVANWPWPKRHRNAF